MIASLLFDRALRSGAGGLAQGYAVFSAHRRVPPAPAENPEGARAKRGFAQIQRLVNAPIQIEMTGCADLEWAEHAGLFGVARSRPSRKRKPKFDDRTVARSLKPLQPPVKWPHVPDLMPLRPFIPF
jgi:hypothetical protein